MSIADSAIRGRSLTASAAQTRVALAASLRPQDPATNVAVHCRLPAGTDANRMAEAVRAVVDTDDSFNEVFDIGTDGVVTATRIWGAARCPVVGYESLPQLRAHVRRIADTPVDIRKWPLHYFEIATVADELYFVFVGSHLVTDGLGFLELSKAIDERYRDRPFAGCTQSPAEFGDAAPSVAAVQYFSELLAGMNDLTVDGWGRRDAQGRIPGAITRHECSRDAYDAAAVLADRLGVRRYSALLTVYGLMIAMLARQPRVVISTPLSNRRMAGESSRTKGLLVNALPVVIDTQRFSTFDELCADVDRQVGALIEYESCPFADIARNLLRAGNVDATVPSASFTLIPRPVAVVIDGQASVPMLVERGYLQYSLSVIMEVGPGSVASKVERSSDFPDVDVPELFWGLVQQVADRTELRLSDIVWADSAATVSRSPVRDVSRPARTIVGEFVDAVRRNSAAIAVEHGVERVTYGELDRRSDALAARIGSLLPQTERFVAVAMEPSTDLVATLLGILKSGRAYVPIHPGLPRERVESMVRAFGGLMLVGVQPREWEDVPGLRYDTLRQPPRSTGRVTPPGPADTAYVIFTSGTTGEPKGVPVTHAAVTSMLSSVAAAMPVRSMRWSLYHSFAFDASVWEIFGALSFDGVLCIPTSEQRSDPTRTAEFLRTAGIQMLSQTPSAFEILGPRIKADAYSPETVVLFGERVDFEKLKVFAQRHVRTRLVNMYGITETTVHAAFYQLPSEIGQWPNGSVIGRPLCDTSITVLDNDRRTLPRGCVGELAVGGAGVMEGYLNREDLTRERIAVVDGERVYLSGDLGVMARDGQLRYLGRMDSQVQVRGHRIELSEIEQVLRACAGVESACALADGDGISRHLLAFVVGARLDVDVVLSCVRARLPSYMVPSRVISVSELPMTTNGKIDHAALLRSVRLGADDASPRSSRSTSDTLEQAITQVWAGVLGHTRFDRRTRFFDAGGSSALLLRVSHQLRTVLDVGDLDVIDLFEHCTPAALADHLNARTRDARKAIR